MYERNQNKILYLKEVNTKNLYIMRSKIIIKPDYKIYFYTKQRKEGEEQCLLSPRAEIAGEFDQVHSSQFTVAIRMT